MTVLIPAAARGQGGAAVDTLSVPGIRLPEPTARRIAWTLPAEFQPSARRLLAGVPTSVIAAEESARLSRVLASRETTLWQTSRERPEASDLLGAAIARAEFGVDTTAQADTARRQLLGGLFGDRPDFGLQFRARFESKLDRQKNERCTAGMLYVIAEQCEAGYLPTFDLQLYTRANGTLADRLHVNVDYDSQREFEASNNISVYYVGKSHEMLDTLQVGNVTLQLPPSQFITSGIPQGNYGIQAIGQIGPAKFRTIVAQQKGHVPKLFEVMVGDRTLKQETRDLDDYQIEARRFFFTVDPVVFGAAYPNIDILDGVQMRALAEGMPDDVRPRGLSVYRLRIGGQPLNPNGPRFTIIGDPNSARGQVYELLRENQDYYADPSLLWIALQRPLNLENERLVLAYTLRINGRDTVIANVGGTPDVSYVPEREQLAHLLWDPQVRPTDPAFRREIRSVYRVAGEDLRRNSVTLRIVTGAGIGQEKPLAGTNETYLQMFGLSQIGNAASFDAENRMWPRPGDPNVAVGGAPNAKIIRDHFLVLPSLRPFARDGLVVLGNPASDTIYVTPSEDLISPQHPPPNYRLQLRYDIEGGGSAGTITIGAVQLRRFSEDVVVDGVRLARGSDYTIDYDIGVVTFARPDTLFARPRRVSVRYEENPLFAAAPTSIFGIASQIPMERGELGFTWLSQRQSTSFTRPPLGYEPQSSQIAGVSGRFAFEAAPISRFLEKLPTVQTTSLSHINISGEFAMSRPQPNSAGQAYIEPFENEGGVVLPLSEAAWYYSSQPALGVQLDLRFGSETFSLPRSSTMAWQNLGFSRTGLPIQYTFTQIDPQVTLTGAGLTSAEPMLWLTLYPLGVGGLLSDRTGQPQWFVENPLPGRRWRSVRMGFGASGVDLSRVEYLEFWTLVDTATARRPTNASLVFDFGDISENSVVFGPSTVTLSPGQGGVTDSLFSGKVFMGFDEMNTERDSISRSFNQARDDKGLPGDVISVLNVVTPTGFDFAPNFRTCSRGAYRLLLLGDHRTNCTVGNGRLDEEDIDLDNVLNLLEIQRESERLRRYIVDLSNPNTYNRIGRCGQSGDSVSGTVGPEKCWVQVRIPYRAPDDSTNGGPNARRIRAMRVTLVSGAGEADTAFTQVPLVRLKLLGSPLIKRSDRTVQGIAGDLATQGFVLASVIGTQDRDTLRNLDYESPPGVTDQAEQQQTGLENLQTQINERSLRLQAGNLGIYERAEAFMRFAEGPRNFMNYRELRTWARGRGNGWGQAGELQFYIKIARDANNFYLFRTPVNSGPGRATWLPEIVVDFNKLTALRAELHSRFTLQSADTLGCTGVDSALVVNSGLPTGQPINRYAVCSDGYMAYSVDPAVNPPNLAQVQEIAVGIVRVANLGGTAPIMPGDTLELWVDDVRLTDVERTPGYAGQISMNVAAGDVASFTVSLSRRDPHFRQLAEQPSFLSSTGVSFASAVRLERLVPGLAAYSVPFSISRTSGSNKPLFLSQSDIPGGDIDGLRTPRADATRYALSIRRVTPITGSAWGILLNNLSVNGSASTAEGRTEYSDGVTSTWNAGLDYNVLANGRFTTLPRWMTPGLDRDAPSARLRLNPTQIRFSSDFAHTSDSRRSFLKPIEVASDTGRVVRALMFYWRTTAAIEMRPINVLTARWDFTSTRDLRNYGDTSASAIVATGERDRIFGIDAGLERDRQMNASIGFSPIVVPWFQPTLSVASSYIMQRDPQARQLARTDDSTGAFRLPRRLSNNQNVTTSAAMDPGRALRRWVADSGWRGRIANMLQPIQLGYSRNVTSMFDGAALTPGAAYQFAYGGIDNFRFLGGRAAAAAGINEVFSAATALRFPGDLALTSRAEITTSSNYARRVDETQALVRGRRERFPDLLVSWTFMRPQSVPTALIPRVFNKLFSQFTATIGTSSSLQSSFSPAETEGGEPDERVTRTKSTPASAIIGWNIRGPVITAVTYRTDHTTDSVPGSVTKTDREVLTVDVNRSFRMPESWGPRSLLRARMGWQQEVQTSYVSVGGPQRSRLADNGRQAFNLNLETDVASNVSMGLQLTRVVTFDNNFNRKFSQFVMTAAFTLRHEIGAIR
ncbi:MAG TPA: cell surface protein SprA [Gemmatimonadaceae bacterium]|nr:cell surface protein SprA [Gemmatimonadaceae bacterium]